MTALRAANDEVAVSDLTRMECRVKPMRLGNATALGLFDGFFVQPDVRLVPLTTAVFDKATQIRAAFPFKTVDALHLAAAVESGCDRFLTNDTRLSKFTDIPVEVLP
jgi:predicted nucleic acid-binding protein